jgi:hypothetical protein
MIEKKELLRGTLKEFQEYFSKINFVKKEDIDKKLYDQVYYTELSKDLSIENQLKKINNSNKKIGMIAYLKIDPVTEVHSNPEVHMTIESNFIFIVDEEKQKEINKLLRIKEK